MLAALTLLAFLAFALTDWVAVNDERPPFVRIGTSTSLLSYRRYRDSKRPSPCRVHSSRLASADRAAGRVYSAEDPPPAICSGCGDSIAGGWTIRRCTSSKR